MAGTAELVGHGTDDAHEVYSLLAARYGAKAGRLVENMFTQRKPIAIIISPAGSSDD